MTPTETVMLTEYVQACCPQQAFNEYTPDAWHDLLGDLAYEDCHAAVQTVTKRQPFVAPAEIRAEVRRIRDDRLARQIPSRLPDEPGPFLAQLRAELARTADGLRMPTAIAGPVREDPPPAEFTEARAKLGPSAPRTKQEIARQQAAESRAEREAQSAEDEPDTGKSAA